MTGVLAGFIGLSAAVTAYEFKDLIFPPTVPEKEQKKTAWYKGQPKAPEMIRLPDTPLILASKDAEIDETIEIIAPKQPLKVKPKAPQPRTPDVHIEAKPPIPVAIYEEALPDDVYTPPTPVITALPDIEKPTPPTKAQLATQQNKPRWMQFALNFEPTPNKPMIALVIDDLGLDQKRTARTLDLPGPMTMAFIPYAKNLSRQTNHAVQQGHELMLHLPMEPLNGKIDAGPNHLHTHLAYEDLIERIHWNLNRFEGYVGVNNHMGSRATTDNAVMRALLSELRNRELLFLDSRTSAKSVGAKLARDIGVAFAERNVFLDNVNEKSAVLKQLSLLEKTARNRGYAVGIGHPRDGTIAALKEWIPALEGRGFTLAPISQIVLKN